MYLFGVLCCTLGFTKTNAAEFLSWGIHHGGGDLETHVTERAMQEVLSEI